MGFAQGVVAQRAFIPNQMLLQLCIPLERSTKVVGKIKNPTRWTLHSLKIFDKGLILPPPLNVYIHWRSSKRV